MRKRFRSTIDLGPIEEPNVNLTPLIDVVFVVLITFILIAPVLDVDSVNLATGGTVEKKELESSMITISVHADNSIWYQNSRVSISELKKLMELEKKRKPNAIPQVLLDEKAEFGTYQLLKNTFEALGFLQMDVILKPE